MMKILGMLGTGLAMVLLGAGGAQAHAGLPGSGAHATVVYDDVATDLMGARVDGAELWVTMPDLTRATRFELKPQGVCRDELCFPLPKERRSEFVREEPLAKGAQGKGGTKWFHLTEFARLVQQPFAYEAGAGDGKRRSLASLGMTESGKGAGIRDDNRLKPMWYFGLRADQRAGLSSLDAPNFTLPDMAGKMHSLADFRGKKVLLVTWASW